MYPKLKNFIQTLETQLPGIPDSRRRKLEELTVYVRSKNPARLTFICTHNSRRSHFCQIWAAVLARYFGVAGVQTYSGGTEATAFNPRAVEAIRRAGFSVEDPGGENPRYKVYFDADSDPLICFSKTYGDPENPQQDFAAVMTCSDADRNCPVVPGADERFSLPYDDPKQADGTPQETQVYDERCRQIAAEIYYMFSRPG